MANTGKYPTVALPKREPMFKRWFDKAFVGLMTVTLGLILAQWKAISDQVADLDRSGHLNSDRATKIEERSEGVEKRLQRIEVTQDKQGDLLNKIYYEVRK